MPFAVQILSNTFSGLFFRFATDPYCQLKIEKEVELWCILSIQFLFCIFHGRNCNLFMSQEKSERFHESTTRGKMKSFTFKKFIFETMMNSEQILKISLSKTDIWTQN